MYQELWIVFALEFCILAASKEQKERTASLIVLPPLVIGYDELYEDQSSEKNKPTTTPKPSQTSKNTIKPNQPDNKPNDNGENNKPKGKSQVKFERNGHVMNFAGHFMLPHQEKDCPFHDDFHHHIESLDLNVNRRNLGNRIIRRNLRNIVKNNVLKNAVSRRGNTVDENGNLVVNGSFAFGGPVKLNKGDSKNENTDRGNASNITDDLIKELMAGMLSGILLNH